LCANFDEAHRPEATVSARQSAATPGSERTEHVFTVCVRLYRVAQNAPLDYKKGVNILQGRVASRLGKGEIVNEDFIAMSAES